MKKIIVLGLWSLSCLAFIPENETSASRIEQALKQGRQAQQEEADRLPKELVDSLIDHSPELVKKYVQYLQYSKNKNEVNPKTLFMYGPSGVGKTETAIALAIKMDMPYTVIHGGRLDQKSAKAQLTECILPLIKRDEPHVIIIDECMTLIENYDDPKATPEEIITALTLCYILDQCDKAKNILIIGTAHNIERCPDIVRTRFGGNQFAKFKMPDAAVRKEILRAHIPKKYSCSDTLLHEVAENTHGLSARVLTNIVVSAVGRLEVMETTRNSLTFDDFKDVIARTKLLYQEKSVFRKMLDNARDAMVKNPIDTASLFLSLLLCI